MLHKYNNFVNEKLIKSIITKQRKTYKLNACTSGVLDGSMICLIRENCIHAMQFTTLYYVDETRYLPEGKLAVARIT